jgi:DNA-binding CsgD family transcriptional regulator
LVAHRDGIEIKAGYLTGSSAAATTALGRAGAWAGCPEGRGGGVRIPRRSGRSDYLVQAGCCPERLAHLPFAPGAAILRIYDPAQSHRLPPAITSLFDLTARETEVAQALLQGHSVDTLASALHISRNTARIHLQRLFHKTGTNRQADLVRLLTSLTAPTHSANGL